MAKKIIEEFITAHISQHFSAFLFCCLQVICFSASSKSFIAFMDMMIHHNLVWSHAKNEDNILNPSPPYIQGLTSFC